MAHKFNITDECLNENGITFQECMLLVALSDYNGLIDLVTAMETKGLIFKSNMQQLGVGNYYINQAGISKLESVLLNSVDKPFSIDLEETAKQLKEIFPKGKKDGTIYYWADGISIIVKRLKLFMKKYGDIYTQDQIVKAAKEYVDSFNGDYRYMKILKYFIFKEKKGADNEIESESDLITYIENSGQTETLRNDWTLELR